MKVTEVEYIVQWAGEHRSYEQKYKEQICFHMCGLFGMDSINCGLMENYSVEHTAQRLRELCYRAGKYTIGVEPMPYSGLPDVKKAWAVVQPPAATTPSCCWTPGTASGRISPWTCRSWRVSRRRRSSPPRSTTCRPIPMPRASCGTSPCTTGCSPALVAATPPAL